MYLGALQVEGAQGVKVLGSKIAAGGPLVLWHGALAASTATCATPPVACIAACVGCLF